MINKVEKESNAFHIMFSTLGSPACGEWTNPTKALVLEGVKKVFRGFTRRKLLCHYAATSNILLKPILLHSPGALWRRYVTPKLLPMPVCHYDSLLVQTLKEKVAWEHSLPNSSPSIKESPTDLLKPYANAHQMTKGQTRPGKIHIQHHIMSQSVNSQWGKFSNAIDIPSYNALGFCLRSSWTALSQRVQIAHVALQWSTSDT